LTAGILAAPPRCYARAVERLPVTTMIPVFNRPALLLEAVAADRMVWR
jgi:hypothetical protein